MMLKVLCEGPDDIAALREIGTSLFGSDGSAVDRTRSHKTATKSSHGWSGGRVAAAISDR